MSHIRDSHFCFIFFPQKHELVTEFTIPQFGPVVIANINKVFGLLLPPFALFPRSDLSQFYVYFLFILLLFLWALFP